MQVWCLLSCGVLLDLSGALGVPRGSPRGVREALEARDLIAWGVAFLVLRVFYIVFRTRVAFEGLFILFFALGRLEGSPRRPF